MRVMHCHIDHVKRSVGVVVVMMLIHVYGNIIRVRIVIMKAIAGISRGELV